ncbi:MAG: class I SAM-dependent methyltransferase [Silvanigrellaceae bacterium]|nr:class I SAM-dependent methyltransferase [Silvanigrellaceae bacterium]
MEYDKKFFGDTFIYVCNKCNLFFTNPMPDNSVLNEFYSKIYRAKGRPHYFDPKAPPLPVDRHYSYISTISQYLNINKLNVVFEIGAGSGQIGLLLKQAAPNISLYCVELDEFSQQTLENRGYSVLSSISQIEKKADLIVSLHSLEHFTSINDFFSIIDKVISPDGKILIEVPNCPFDNGFKARPYDSPHLLFFTEQSLKDSLERRGYEVIFLQTIGPSFNEDFQACQKWKNIYEKWTPLRPDFNLTMYSKIRKIILKLIPNRLRSILRSIIKNEEVRRFELSEFYFNKQDSSALRVVAKKSSHNFKS